MADERLKAIDADHFWFDGVLIDMPSLYCEARRVANSGEWPEFNPKGGQR